MAGNSSRIPCVGRTYHGPSRNALGNTAWIVAPGRDGGNFVAAPSRATRLKTSPRRRGTRAFGLAAEGVVVAPSKQALDTEFSLRQTELVRAPYLVVAHRGTAARPDAVELALSVPAGDYLHLLALRVLSRDADVAFRGEVALLEVVEVLEVVR